MAEYRRRGGNDDLPRPTAKRLQRPSWRDTRLVVGVLFMLVATVGGGMAMRHYDTSVEVLQAAHTLVPGQRITSDDVRTVKVRVDGAAKTYFSGTGSKPEGQVLREVRPGELLPRSAVGDGSQVLVSTVALPVDAAQSATLVRGSIVDVWVSAKTRSATGQESYEAPQRIILRALVAQVPQQSGGLSVSSGEGAVHVLVPEAKVAAVLAAVNQGAKVNLVPAAGSPLKGS